MFNFLSSTLSIQHSWCSSQIPVYSSLSHCPGLSSILLFLEALPGGWVLGSPSLQPMNCTTPVLPHPFPLPVGLGISQLSSLQELPPNALTSPEVPSNLQPLPFLKDGTTLSQEGRDPSCHLTSSSRPLESRSSKNTHGMN